jgi:hypothetical protein
VTLDTFHNGKIHNMTWIVMCTAGLHELYGEWPVAAFTHPELAQEWCDRANEYGVWMEKMVEEHWKDETRILRFERTDDMDDDEYLDGCDREPSSQYHWALHGSPGQMQQWEDEYDEAHPDGDWLEHYVRELSLILNPYDERAYHALYERRVRYKVVARLTDVEGPYFP